MKKIITESEIKIKIGLNDAKFPEKIRWMATDNPEGDRWHESKAMLLSFFDKKTSETMKIDLWTSEMQVFEMDRFMYQTLRALADTYFNSTKNAALANEMVKFVQYFGEKTEITGKQ